MNVDFYAVSQKHLTFLAEEGVVPGTFVKITANATVSPCASGDTPIGICTASEGDCVSVQLEGHCKITYASPEETPVNLGYQQLVLSLIHIYDLGCHCKDNSKDQTDSSDNQNV